MRPTTSYTWSHNSILPDPLALDERPPRALATFTHNCRPYEDVSARARDWDWCGRHHVVDSRLNQDLAPGRRVFFDVLPQLRVRQGAYSDVPLFVVRDVHDDPSRGVDSLRWKWAQYPQFLRPSTTSLASSRTTLPDVEAERAAQLDSNSDLLSAQALSFEPTPVAFGRRVSSKPPPIGTCSSSLPSKRPDTKELASSPRREKRGVQVKSAIAGPPELVDFIRFCEAKHGHLVNTWRKLDTDGNMTLSKAEFLKGLRVMDYIGDGHKLWNIFNPDEDRRLTFIRFVPDLAIDLARFKHWAEERFKGVKATFRAFDQNCNGKLSYKEFLHACERFGMWPKLKDIVHTLFVMLDDGGRKEDIGEITESELEFLERWKCPPYLWAEPDFDAKRQFLKQLLLRNKESPLIAWRKALDKDGNMKVSYGEFYLACVKLIRSGAMADNRNNFELVNRLYVSFDPHRCGYISLRRWDKRVYQLLVNFTLWARREFGKVSSAVPTWERECSLPGHGIALGMFRSGTQSLGMTEEELRLLFSGLSLEGIALKHGRISFEELLFLDNWDPEKMLQEELAWEKMVGSRFSSAGGHAPPKRFAAAVHAVSLRNSLQALREEPHIDGSQEDFA